MIIYGEEDSEAAADARRLYRQLERYHPQTAKPLSGQQSLVLMGLPSALEGSQLLRESAAQIEGPIISFLAAHAGNQDFPWLQRRNRGS
jgi:hypothetical protein